MEFSWEYPLFTVPHGDGFASVVKPDAEGNLQMSVAVFTDRERAERFCRQAGLTGTPQPIDSTDELLRFAGALVAPARALAFDPEPTEQAINARWIVAVETLIEQHRPSGFSWRLPVFAIAQGDSFASIEGVGEQGPMLAVALFTHASLVRDFLEQAGEDGEQIELADAAILAAFLTALPAQVATAAMNPQAEGDRRIANWCVDIATLIEKYLNEKE